MLSTVAKPNGEQLWTICRELNVAPHNTIMVGDTCTDMELGKNAGVGLSVGVLGTSIFLCLSFLRSTHKIPNQAVHPPWTIWPKMLIFSFLT